MSSNPPFPPEDATAGAASAENPDHAGNPWEQRAQLGFGNAIVAAAKLFITAPGEAFSRTRETGDLASPILFAVIMGWVGALASLVWGAVLGASLIAFVPEQARAGLSTFLALGPVAVVWRLVVTPIVIVVFVFLASLVLHVCLLMVGGTSASRSGFEGTVRAVSYASVAGLAEFIPIVGGLIHLVWGIILGTIGLARLHRTTEGRAFVAILIPVIACCACAVVGILLGVGAFLAAMGQAK